MTHLRTAGAVTVAGEGLACIIARHIGTLRHPLPIMGTHAIILARAHITGMGMAVMGVATTAVDTTTGKHSLIYNGTKAFLLLG